MKRCRSWYAEYFFYLAAVCSICIPLCSRNRVHRKQKGPPHDTYRYPFVRTTRCMVDRNLVVATHKLKLAQPNAHPVTTTLVLLATQSASNLPSSGPFLQHSVIVTRLHHHRHLPRRHTVAGARHYSSNPSPRPCCAYTSLRPVPVLLQCQNPP